MDFTFDYNKLKSELIEDEGYRIYPYPDSEGIWTGGIGHNLQANGIPDAVIQAYKRSGIPSGTIDYWFRTDVEKSFVCCKEIFLDFISLPDNVQRVLMNMAFDLRYELRDWHHLLKAVADKDWIVAAHSISNSLFAKQVGKRAQRLIARILS